MFSKCHVWKMVDGDAHFFHLKKLSKCQSSTVFFISMPWHAKFPALTLCRAAQAVTVELGIVFSHECAAIRGDATRGCRFTSGLGFDEHMEDPDGAYRMALDG